LQYRLSAMVNIKVTWSGRKTQSISFFDSKDEIDLSTRLRDFD